MSKQSEIWEELYAAELKRDANTPPPELEIIELLQQYVRDGRITLNMYARMIKHHPLKSETRLEFYRRMTMTSSNKRCEDCMAKLEPHECMAGICTICAQNRQRKY